MDSSFFYCERNNLSLLAEPLNLFTNLLFLFFSILLFYDKTVKNKIFTYILFGIGTGSMLYHSIATSFTALIDIAFIILFIFYYLVILYNKLNLKKNYAYILSLIFILVCYTFGYFSYNSILGSSAFYLPILLHLVLLLFYFIYTKKYFYFKRFFFYPYNIFNFFMLKNSRYKILLYFFNWYSFFLAYIKCYSLIFINKVYTFNSPRNLPKKTNLSLKKTKYFHIMHVQNLPVIMI